MNVPEWLAHPFGFGAKKKVEQESAQRLASEQKLIKTKRLSGPIYPMVYTNSTCKVYTDSIWKNYQQEANLKCQEANKGDSAIYKDRDDIVNPFTGKIEPADLWECTKCEGSK